MGDAIGPAVHRRRQADHLPLDGQAARRCRRAQTGAGDGGPGSAAIRTATGRSLIGGGAVRHGQTNLKAMQQARARQPPAAGILSITCCTPMAAPTARWRLSSIESASLAERLAPDLPYIKAEIVHAVRNEMAVTLIDVLNRRLHLLMEERNQGLDQLAEVAALAGRELGWTRRLSRRMYRQNARIYTGRSCPDAAHTAIGGWSVLRLSLLQPAQ